MSTILSEQKPINWKDSEKISHWDEETIKAINNLGKVAVYILNESGLKDRSPILYFYLKDMCVKLMNCGTEFDK